MTGNVRSTPHSDWFYRLTVASYPMHFPRLACYTVVQMSQTDDKRASADR